MHLDEHTAGAYLSRLDEDPPVPSTVDVGRAVRTGLRRRRVRRLGGYTAVAATVAVLVGAAAVAGGWRGPARPATGSQAGSRPSSAAAPDAVAPAGPASCALRQLPLPDGRSMALVTGGDPSGRFLAGRTYPQKMAGTSMGLHIVVWDRLRPTIVSMPGDDQSLEDINSNGVAVGFSYETSGNVAYYYRAGAAKVTKLPGGDGAEARAINDAGTVVGMQKLQPVLWRTVDQAPVRLAMPAGATWGQAVDIDEDGTVIGSVGTSMSDQRPYVWSPDGIGRALPVPSGIPAPSAGSGPGASGAKTGKAPVVVYHIRDGWVIGRVNATAVRWNLRTGQIRQFPPFSGFAEAVNRYGWQIGLTGGAGALLLTDRASIRLPALATHPAGSLSTIPTTLSDDGTLIGGQSDDNGGVIHAVAWTCH